MGSRPPTGEPWAAALIADRLLPGRTPADVAAETRLVAYDGAAAGHLGRARALMMLDACGTATALRIGGHRAHAARRPRVPKERAVAETIALGVAAEHLDEGWLRAAHRAVAADLPPERRGRYRRREAWVAFDPSDVRSAVHIAPEPARLPELVADLLTHCAAVSASPLPVAAVAFAQLVCCHPFEDANGRVARLLMATLLRRGLSVEHTPPIGLVLGANRALVTERLAAYRAGDTASWVAHAAAVAVTAADAADQSLTQ